LSNRRTLALALVAAAAALLAVTSLAYACAVITGSITTTYNGTTCQNSPPSCRVQPGAAISSTGSQLASVNGMYWSLYFLESKRLSGNVHTCMSDLPGQVEQRIGGPVQQSNGSVGPVTAQIPLTALQSTSDTGPALVCWIASDSRGFPNYNYATPPTELEVLGGREPRGAVADVDTELRTNSSTRHRPTQAPLRTPIPISRQSGESSKLTHVPSTGRTRQRVIPRGMLRATSIGCGRANPRLATAAFRWSFTTKSR